MSNSGDDRPAVRSGDVVRVRSRDEILQTLDGDGRIDGLPFMPEMLAFAGRELPVFRRADKTCDTIEHTGTRRRMSRTVHLAEARCDGSAHGGCEASCLLFFREEWLERPDGTPLHAFPAGPDRADAASDGTLVEDTIAGKDDDGEPLYRCQATELLRASSGGLSPYDWSQYVDDVRTRNERPAVIFRGLSVLFFNIFQRFSRRHLPARLRIHNGDEYPFLRGTGPAPTPPPLDLEVGELVEIKSKAEIEATLNGDNRNRGMVFDAEMLVFCGRRARVIKRVGRIINEKTGRMIKLKDCIMLDGVVCTGIYHRFCQRAIYAYWRESWLRRVDPAPSSDNRSMVANRA